MSREFEKKAQEAYLAVDEFEKKAQEAYLAVDDEMLDSMIKDTDKNMLVVLTIIRARVGKLVESGWADKQKPGDLMVRALNVCHVPYREWIEDAIQREFDQIKAKSITENKMVQ